MTVAQNCLHGSTLSPPRLQQIRDTVKEYFVTATVSDEYFQFWLPFLVVSLQLRLDTAAEGAAEVMASGDPMGKTAPTYFSTLFVFVVVSFSPPLFS